MAYLNFEEPVIKIDQKIEELRKLEQDDQIDFESEIQRLEERRNTLLKEVYSSLSPWQVIQVARHPQRPSFLDYMKFLVSDFEEIHGDRNFADDQSIVCGFGTLENEKILFIGHQKGKDTKENLLRNFGMPRPEGYRKALRVMKLAEKFSKPVITFIDTPGAYPGMDAEERGQSEAIATNLYEMSRLKVPIISIVIGEGGSGGALALGVGNRILMLSNSTYSVISPEGCASILWKDPAKAPDAAEALKFTAKDLLSFGLIDDIIEEPLGAAHRNHLEISQKIKEAIITHLKPLKKMSSKKIVEKRYEKFIKMGQVFG